MYGREEKYTRRLFGFFYFSFGILLFLAAVRFLCSDVPLRLLQSVFPFAAQTEIVAENAEDPYDKSVASEAVSSFYETPSDVAQMEAEYLAVFAAQEEDGAVIADDFSTAGATDFVHNTAIRNATASQQPDFENLLSLGADLQINQTDESLVLIYHTHTSESYLLSDNGGFWSSYETRSEAQDRNMIRVGAEMKSVLESAGIGVIHDTTVYDTQYNGAYARSREGIEKILAENPSVQIVLDVHRDAFYYSDTSRGKPVTEIDGKNAAQVMIIAGAQEGQITHFPDWEYNLRFALELQNTASGMFEGLMRPLYFCQRKYNMDIAKNALLLEIGTDANTLDEALYAAHLCAKALVQVIENHK